jgi:hypothetical protein
MRSLSPCCKDRLRGLKEPVGPCMISATWFQPRSGDSRKPRAKALGTAIKRRVSAESARQDAIGKMLYTLPYPWQTLWVA